MHLKFKDVIDKMKYHIGRKEEGYPMPMMPRYNKIVGNIIPGIYTAVAGISASGKTSFVDQNYVMTTLLQWYETDPDERKPLHISYFTPRSTELKKLQQFICLYVKLVHGLIVDVPTLNSQPGRLFNVGQDKKLLEALDEAEQFFDTIINEHVLEIHARPMTPSAVYSTMTDYMKELGTIDDDGIYTIDEDFEESLVMAVIDDAEDLSMETDGFSSPSTGATMEKLDSFLKRLAHTYNINCTVVIPATVGYVRTPKDTEPCPRHLGIFLKHCDRGVVVYNPIGEENKRLYDDSNVYIGTRSGAVLMRYWFVVRNTDGIDSARDRMLFLPGVGYSIEYDQNKEVFDASVTESILADKNKSAFYIDKTPTVEDDEE